MAPIGRNNAGQVVALQFWVTLAIASVLYLTSGNNAAGSALAGGAIGFVPAWLYATRMIKVRGTEPSDLLRAQYKAEFYKFAATFVLFALTFALFRDVSAATLFLTYFATLAVYWVALLAF